MHLFNDGPLKTKISVAISDIFRVDRSTAQTQGLALKTNVDFFPQHHLHASSIFALACMCMLLFKFLPFEAGHSCRKEHKICSETFSIYIHIN